MAISQSTDSQTKIKDPGESRWTLFLGIFCPKPLTNMWATVQGREYNTSISNAHSSQYRLTENLQVYQKMLMSPNTPRKYNYLFEHNKNRKSLGEAREGSA